MFRPGNSQTDWSVLREYVWFRGTCIIYADLPEQYHDCSAALENRCVPAQRMLRRIVLYCRDSVPSTAQARRDIIWQQENAPRSLATSRLISWRNLLPVLEMSAKTGNQVIHGNVPLTLPRDPDMVNHKTASKDITRTWLLSSWK